MKVITLKMPWCFWVAIGWKKIETRTHKQFANLKGKRIGIHAGLSWDKNWEEDARNFLNEKQIEKTKKMLHIGGFIICTAYVDDFRKLDANDSKDSLCDCENVERYGLFLSDIQLIEAIPVSGKLGAWEYNIK